MTSKPIIAHEPIAIVGIGCRYPGANDVREFWDLLVHERNAIREVPKERFDIDAFYDPRPAMPGKLIARGGGFIDDVFGFDAEFFRISPREAARLDPQQRLILEVSAEALDDAFMSKAELARHLTGVYVGAWASDWECHEYADRAHSDVYSMAGSGRCLLSGRVSFAFDLRGPSLTVDTGCSASLLAAHLACQSLWLGETSLAVVAGVNLVLDPKQGITFSQGGMLALDSQCKAFAATADGLVRSDGCGALVLMPLSAAQARGARVYALIRGSGASNDGFSNGLLATPSEIGQEQAMRAAYRSAGLCPSDVQYVEAHGTGTRAGDPVELRALAALMRERVGEPCLVGSVKTNIGHTEGAAGVAGLIKAALSIHQRVIPKSLHCEQPTAEVAWQDMKLRVADRTQPWPEGLARAGVSSFGISGTDVHMVLEELPSAAAPVAQDSEDRAELLLLSAVSEPALQASAQAYKTLLEGPAAETGTLREISYSAALGRQHHPRRVALVGRSRAECSEALDAFANHDPHPSLAANSCATAPDRPVFVFSGQGSQWYGMGRALLASEPVFRQAIHACDAALRRHSGWSLCDELTREAGEMRPIDVIQPSLFGLQVALAALWRAWGIEPGLVIGHSMGEVAAAHVAGVLSLDDAALIICRRSQNLQALAGRGAMLSVELGITAAELLVARYTGRVSIAASNSLHTTVLSGDRDALQAIAAALEAQKVFCREVSVDAAAHSPQLDPLLPEFGRALAQVRPHASAQIPICSTVSATQLPASAFDAAYWVRNQREPVRFSAAVQGLIRAGHTQFVELSPHPILLGPIQQLLADEKRSGVALASLRRDEDERTALLRSLAQLHVLGHDVHFEALFEAPTRFVSLPSYAWQHDRFDTWPGLDDAPSQAAAHSGGRIDAGSLGTALRSALHPRTQLRQIALSPAASSYLSDHVVQGAVLLPGAAYLDMALQAAEQAFGTRQFALERMELATALVLNSAATTELQLALSMDEPGSACIRFFTPAADGGATWTLHATAFARLLADAPPAPEPLDVAAILARCEAASVEEHYATARTRMISYGPAFQGIEALWTGQGEALAQVALPSGVAWQQGAFAIHPALLDACWQPLAAYVFANTPEDSLLLPVAVERVERWGEALTQVWAHARLTSAPDADEVSADIRIFDRAGRALLETRGFRLRQVKARGASLDDALYALRWTPRTAARDVQPAFAGQTWLVLADRTLGVASRLVARLEAAGASCVVVEASAESEADGGKLDPADAQGMQALIGGLAARRGAALAGVIDLWPLDAVRSADATPKTLLEAQRLGVVGAAHVVQALSASALRRPQLWIVTAGAQPVTPNQSVEVAQAPIWAFARVLRYEFPEFRTHSLDLSPDVSECELQAFVQELAGAGDADQIALRGEQRWVLQLVRDGASTHSAPRHDGAPRATPAFRLGTRAAGVLDNLKLEETARAQPGPGEVEIAVSAAGLNFIDVMKALNVYPGMGDAPIQFGGECAGVISALGQGVEGLQVGQRVVAMAGAADGCFARYVITRAALVAPWPSALTAAQAASVPAVFLTAEYALHQLGRLAAGERVLIHSGAGGVGLAAIQLAQRAGAEIYATAGSPEKRAFLRGLGVEHVYDSRSNAFAAQILSATHGQGVDVVLNSLAGEALKQSLLLLRDDGRFLEIGKRDIYADMLLGLAPFKRGLSFSHIDIGRLVKDRPERMGDLLRDLLQRFEAGSLSPLPHTSFAIAQADEAFRYMAQAKHIGKIVLEGFAEPQTSEQVEPRSDAPLANAAASYLITGGLGGLGLLVAQWLVEQGARHLLLLGRHAPGSAALSVIERLRNQGVEVVVQACDVSRSNDVARVFALAQRSMPPLRGIVHAAAVLDDGVALQLTPARFANAMSPKLLGAWNLHVQSAALPLDFFVLFSSAASALGSPGQGNYAAGNEFLDALAHQRRALGLPALSINWGPWRESGIAARDDRAGRLMARGMGSVSDREGIALLGRLMRSTRTQSVVLPAADFSKWRAFYPASAVGMLETLLAETPLTEADADGGGQSVRSAVLAAEPEARAERLEAYLAEVIRRVLRIPSSKPLAGDVPLNRFGIDSLMAVELKNRMEADLAVTIPVSKILLSTGLQSFARELLELLPQAGAAPQLDTAAPAPSAPLERVLTALTGVPDAEAELLDFYDEAQGDAA